MYIKCVHVAILEASSWETLNRAFSIDKYCPHEIIQTLHIEASHFNIAITVRILFNVTNFDVLKNWLCI